MRKKKVMVLLLTAAVFISALPATNVQAAETKPQTSEEAEDEEESAVE